MGVGGYPHAPANSTSGKDPVPILQEDGWAAGPVWTGGKSRPHRDSIPDRPARSSVAVPTELPGPHLSYGSVIFTQATKTCQFHMMGIVHTSKNNMLEISYCHCNSSAQKPAFQLIT